MKLIAAIAGWQPTHVSRAAVLLLGLAPLAMVVVDAVGDGLGANPVEAVLHRTGDWSLRLLLGTLAVTPLRRWTGWQWPMRFRRLVGLLAFAYALLHGLTYAVLDRGLVWDEILVDVLKRPYVTVGFTALLLMVPLALTSTRAMMRRLGPRWQHLHRLVYAVGVLGVLHFLWSSKLDRVEPVVDALILVALLAARVPALLPQRRRPLGERRCETGS